MTKPIAADTPHFLLWEPYTKTDKHLFFGRDREMKALYDKTFASNLVLLYGPSGAGKTSLIQCGLGNMFEDSDWYPVRIRKGDNILKSLSVALRRAADDPEALRNNSIQEKIHHLFLEKFRPIFLIFDQFEELFILGDREEQDQFFRMLVEVMANNLQCKIILSIKEDFLANMDRYEDAVPFLFYNRMRIERMRTEQLEQVIRGLTSRMGIMLGGPEDGFYEQDEIIAAILEKVRDDTHRVDLGELQIFLDELSSKDEQRREKENDDPDRPLYFDMSLVQQTDDVDTVIANRLQKKLEDVNQLFQRKTGIERLPHLVLRTLVTEMETKRTRKVEDIENQLLNRYEILPEHVPECVQALVTTGILRNISKPGATTIEAGHIVEITHDNLAKRIYPLLFSEERNIIRVKNFIHVQYESYDEAGVKLNKDDLDYIQPYLSQIENDIPAEHVEFVSISRKELSKRELRLGMIRTVVSVVLLVISVIALLQWLRFSRNAHANIITAQALDAMQYDRTLALRMAEYALSREQRNTLANNVLNDVLIDAANFPFYQKVYTMDTEEIDRISDMDVSDNGKYLVAGSLDGSIYLLNLWQSDLLRKLNVEKTEDRHTAEITDIDFLTGFDNIKYGFITSSRDGTAKIWEIMHQDSVAVLKDTLNHDNPLAAVHFDKKQPQPTVYAAGEKAIYRHRRTGTENNRKWQIDTFNIALANAFEIVNYSGGQYLIAAGRDTCYVARIDGTEDSSDIIKHDFAGTTIISLEHSERDGMVKFAAGLDDGRLITWKLDNVFLNQPLSITDIDYRSREAHTQAIKDVVFIDGGKQILTSSEDKSAKLWNAELVVIKTFLGHNDGVQTITSAKEGKIIYTGGEDKTIKEWQLDQYTTDPLPQGRDSITALAYHAAKRKLLVRNRYRGADHLVVYSGANLSERESFEPETAIPEIAAMAFMPDGEHILLAPAGEHHVLILDGYGVKVDSLTDTDTLGHAVTGIAVADDGKYVATLCQDSMYIHKRQSGFRYKNVAKLPGQFRSVAFSNNDRKETYMLTVAKGSNKVLLYRLHENGHTAMSAVDSIIHTDEVLSLAMAPDGRQFLTGSSDNSFVYGRQRRRVWSGAAKFVQSREPKHTADVSVVAFSPDTSPLRFLTAGQNGILRLWNSDGQEEKSMIDHGGPIVDAIFLSEDKVLTLGADGRARIWDTVKIEGLLETGNGRVYGWSSKDMQLLIVQ